MQAIYGDIRPKIKTCYIKPFGCQNMGRSVRFFFFFLNFFVVALFGPIFFRFDFSFSFFSRSLLADISQFVML